MICFVGVFRGTRSDDLLDMFCNKNTSELAKPVGTPLIHVWIGGKRSPRKRPCPIHQGLGAWLGEVHSGLRGMVPSQAVRDGRSTMPCFMGRFPVFGSLVWISFPTDSHHRNRFAKRRETPFQTSGLRGQSSLGHFQAE